MRTQPAREALEFLREIATILEPLGYPFVQTFIHERLQIIEEAVYGRRPLDEIAETPAPPPPASPAIEVKIEGRSRALDSAGAERLLNAAELLREAYQEAPHAENCAAKLRTATCDCWRVHARAALIGVFTKPFAADIRIAALDDYDPELDLCICDHKRSDHDGNWACERCPCTNFTTPLIVVAPEPGPEVKAAAGEDDIPY